MLAFVSGPNAGQNGNPIKSLFGFTRFLAMTGGSTKTITFPLTAFDLSHVDENGKRFTTAGEWRVNVEGAETIITVVE